MKKSINNFNISEYPQLSRFIEFEQTLENKELYHKKLADELFLNDLDEKYQPGSQSMFPLTYFLIPFQSDNSLVKMSKDKDLDSLFSYIDKSKDFYPFFVHPSTISFFKSLLGGEYRYIDESESNFTATPTSSLRTLLVFSDLKPFFAKTSIFTNLTRGSRHIDWYSAVGQHESAVIAKKVFKRSRLLPLMDIAAFGLELNKEIELPSHLKVMYGKNQIKKFGTVIRKIPDEILSNKFSMISVASASSPTRKPGPFVLDWARIKKKKYKDWINEEVYSPLNEVLEQMIIIDGVTIEPHCQNLLFQIDKKGNPTGKFYYRDFDIVGLDRARFPFLHPELWMDYLKDRPDRIIIKENLDVRDRITQCIHHQFLGNAISPLFAVGKMYDEISAKEIFDFFSKALDKWIATFSKAFPLCKKEIWEKSGREFPSYDFFSDISISEIPSKLNSFDGNPEKVNFIALAENCDDENFCLYHASGILIKAIKDKIVGISVSGKASSLNMEVT